MAKLKYKDGDEWKSIAPSQEEFDLHKLDYANYQSSNNLKIASVERELNNYKSTMANVNVNQEAKQTASGYGVVSLPKNASNGNADVSVEGLTATNSIDNGANYNNWTSLDSIIHFNNGIEGTIVSAGYCRMLNSVKKLNSGNTYTLFYTIESGSISSLSLFSVSAEQVSGLPRTTGKHRVKFTAGGSSPFPQLIAYGNEGGKIKIVDIMIVGGDWTTGELASEQLNYISFGTKSTISAMRLKSVNENEIQESVMYLPNVGELRSLPNGVRDEIRVSGGKAELVKRLGQVILDGSEDWNLQSVNEHGIANFSLRLANLNITFPTTWVSGASFNNRVTVGAFKAQTSLVADTIEEGYFINENQSLFIRILASKLTTQDVVGFKAWLQANPTTLIYQLAEPVFTPIEVSGTLLSNPSGTVYVEPVVADAGIYTDKLNVLDSGLPIDYIKKLSKVDFNTGVETELDASQCVVAEDKLSFTHPDLTANDIVFFTYFHKLEGTQGETTIEYYDSRHTLKDSVTGKFYKVVPTVADGILTNQLVEV